jgi:hypothetical protein
MNLRKKVISDEKYITLETTPLKLPTFNGVLEKIEKTESYKFIDGFSTTCLLYTSPSPRD